MAKGFTQKFEIDYDEVIAPVLKQKNSPHVIGSGWSEDDARETYRYKNAIFSHIMEEI